MKKYFTFFIGLVLIACGSDDNGANPDYTEENEAEILAYIDAEGLNALRSETGLYYVIDELGLGVSPGPTDDVTVAYKGYFTDGEVFDESDDNGISFNLRQVIPGWTEGITYFRVGGSGKLLVPSRLAYGNPGRGEIPPGAVLVFDIRLLSVD